MLTNSKNWRMVGVIGLCAMSLCAVAAPYYEVGGMVSTVATGGESVYRNIAGLQQTSLSDEASSRGVTDTNGLTNLGWAGYHANLANGSLGAFALANNSGNYLDWAGSFAYRNQAVAYSSVRLEDDLYFTIPTGVYHDALIVTLYGRMDGSLSAGGFYVAGGDYYASLLGPKTPGIQYPWQYSGGIGQCWPGPGCTQYVSNGLVDIDDLFQLTATLLAPGTDVVEDLVVGMHVELALGSARPITAGEVYSPQDLMPPYSYAGSAFDQTLRIYAMDVPEGISWTSSSGVFLSHLRAQPVPEPGTLGLLISGLMLLLVPGARSRLLDTTPAEKTSY